MSDPFDLDDDFAPAAPAQAPPPDFLAGLNDAQRQAAEALDGPVLVLAGAGTGKTRVLTTRIALLLATGRAAPWQVLAVTFTNKAAREMRQRVEGLVGRPMEAMWLGTFHAMAARILRRHAEVVGLKSSFTILDTDDQLRLLRTLIEEAELDEKRWSARALAGLIDRWKDRGYRPDAVPEGERSDWGLGKSADLFAAYQARLVQLNAVDFGDLLLHNLTLFGRAPEVLAKYQQQFRYILVDEYQDTNVAQYLWLRLMAQRYHNLCVVGDEDQSVYGWRGAEIGNILKFEKDFPGAQVIRLERNYRSTPHILGAASGLIANNRERLGKTLWTDIAAGDRVQVKALWDDAEEARHVAAECEAARRRGTPFAEMAILVRASFQTRAFEERFLATGIPYRVVGGLRFYERAEIRDALAYLRLIAEPAFDPAFERIVNKPARKIGDATLRPLHKARRQTGRAMLDLARAMSATDELPAAGRKGLAAFVAQIDGWREAAAILKPEDLVDRVLEASGYIDHWRRDAAPDSPGRVENLKELVHAVAEFESLTEFLEHVSLVTDDIKAADADMVSIMTLHGAKGLEFDLVFLPGWEENLFPHRRALDESGDRGLEEERRLAYVGLTRARKKAIVSHVSARVIHGQWQPASPSRFVRELPAGHVLAAGAQGLAGSGGVLGRGGGRRIERDDDDIPWDDDPAPSRRAFPRPQAPAIRPTRVAATTLRPGDRVRHSKFGYGQVAAIEGETLTIDFDSGGRKHVIAAFVEPG